MQQSCVALLCIHCHDAHRIYHEASTTFSLDLCPDFMVSVVGQASFLFHISQQFLPILEGISVEKSKLRGGRFHFTFKNM